MREEFLAILRAPHHVSEKHPPMPIRDRAAQFAPFSALTGFDDEISEATRINDERFKDGTSSRADDV